MSSLIWFLFKLSRQRNVRSYFVLVTSISFPDTWVVFLFQAAQAAPVSCRSSSSAPFPSAPPATRPPCTASTPTASCTSSCSTSSTYFRFVEEVGWVVRQKEIIFLKILLPDFSSRLACLRILNREISIETS